MTAAVGDCTRQTVAAADGTWRLTMPKMQAGGPLTLTVTGANTLKIKDVLFGEVWFASGQSNMELPVFKAQNFEDEKKAATDSEIRFFMVMPFSADEPAQDVRGEWAVCSPTTVSKFSAAGYFFARELRADRKVPVGIIHASWGGRKIELFMDSAALHSQSKFAPLLDTWKKLEGPYKADREKKLATPATNPEDKHLQDVARARYWQNPGAIYNGMIAPIVGYTIRGVIWYQGESNVNNAYEYRMLMPELIHQWRAVWGQGEFPFLYVQLANYAPRPEIIAQNYTSELREAQLRTLSVPYTAMAVTIDIGNRMDIHPKNKQEVGRRLALAAQALAYGEPIEYSGPLYDSLAVEGGKIRIHFKHVGSGLLAKGDELKGFEIAGEDQTYMPAKATIDKDSILVWNSGVAKPVAVRYAWAQDPECNLYNTIRMGCRPLHSERTAGSAIPRKISPPFHC